MYRAEKTFDDYWDQSDKARAPEWEPYQVQPSRAPTTRPWMRRLTKCCTYLMAGCSIVLPAAILILGMIIMFEMPGKLVSSNWSMMEGIVDAAVAIWPVVFAAVLVQCFRTWVLFGAHRGYSEGSKLMGSRTRSLYFHRLDVMSILVFLVWCLSPIGSQALGLVYGVTSNLEDAQVDIRYVDRTGYNQMWSLDSTSPAGSTSTANRSQLVQIIGEKYMGAMSTSSDSYLNGLATAYISSKSGYASSGSKAGTRDLATLSSGDSVRDTISDTAVINGSGNFTFSFTTSYFDLTCGHWSQTIRTFDNTTSPGQMSYSSSQTLGMHMSSGDNSTTTPMSTLTFVSLNSNSLTNTSELKRRQDHGTSSVAGEQWEYSSIQCQYQQLFYNVPMICSQDNNTSVVSCSQYDEPQLILSSTDLAGTQLGDFAAEFALTGNLATTSDSATESEWSSNLLA